MLNIFKKKLIECNLYSPVNGKIIDLEKVPDKVFASKTLGEGIAFDLNDEIVAAPCNGTITLIASTLHSFAMKSENGVEILIHIGLDTVNLNGKGFSILVNQGSKIKKGQPIIKIDCSFMKESNINLITPMIITNGADYDIAFKETKGVAKRGETCLISCKKK
jgi:glucose-specific phosphotransferase system IIA component